MRLLLAILILAPILSEAQVKPSAVKALNAHVEYINASADEINQVVESIREYYPLLERKNASPRYVCPSQLDEYYHSNIIQQSKNLPQVISFKLADELGRFHVIHALITEKCRALDTYHKLQDYKRDDFREARKLIDEIENLLKDYSKNQESFFAALRQAYNQIAPDAGAYHSAATNMLEIIQQEKLFLDTWNYNLEEKVHTGFDVERLIGSIIKTKESLKALEKVKPALKYPASTMWPHFKESLNSILEVKQNGWDQYNFGARTSDSHTNSLYVDLINYYNGTLVADYNTFIGFAERDGYYGLKAVKYVTTYSIRTVAVSVPIKPVAFVDRSVPDIKVTPAGKVMSKEIFEALINYVDFINETWRQIHSHQSVLTSFNSSASSFRNLVSYTSRAPLHFDGDGFYLPHASLTETVFASKALSPEYTSVLNIRANILFDILTEMHDLTAEIDLEVTTRKYESDRLTRIYEILERQAKLFEIWDERKELLYSDVRKVFDSYSSAQPNSSWQVSGTALQNLTDVDREALFQAKSYYKGDSTIKISTEAIDAHLREVISKEFENMKGIEKLGRNHGLCPYTPYEDLPQTSRQLSEKLTMLAPVKSTSRHNHPYHAMVYLYNDVVDDLNKFAELSTDVYILKAVKQPELFAVQYPREQGTKPSGTLPIRPSVATEEEKPQPKPSVSQSQSIIRDTVYIEKRDTVYLTQPVDETMSMEGYAINNMILLLDISGSMNQPGKLPLLKKAMLDMIGMMREEDRITIIGFSSKPKLLLKSASFKNEKKISAAVSDLSSSGKTDANAALKLAYKFADENYLRGGNNRIILATDGEFTLSDESRQLISSFSKEDIFLSVFNFGKGMGTSRELEKLAVLGHGNYQSISSENARRNLIREAKAKRNKTP